MLREMEQTELNLAAMTALAKSETTCGLVGETGRFCVQFPRFESKVTIPRRTTVPIN